MIVGLTGGIATGKSLVSKELKRLGARVVDADAIAREVSAAGSPACGEIVKEFGRGILGSGGVLDRKRLAGIIFNDPESRRRLDRIMHPRIIKRMREEAGRLRRIDPDALIVFEAPLLFEAGLNKDVDRIIVVVSDEDRQIERLRRKEGLTAKDARKRIMSQMPLDEKKKLADHIIYNNGTVEEALKEAGSLYERLAGGARDAKKRSTASRKRDNLK
ncbi:MAG: dephospho-CoA kinase [Deltaproteobacteria bacterium]|nr:dephospho-CoA kinase [Deltaproteobacteria bacterium]